MRRNDIARVRSLAEEIVLLCDKATATDDPSAHVYGSKDTAALRRRSMDLTRALADLRHPWRKDNS